MRNASTIIATALCTVACSTMPFGETTSAADDDVSVASADPTLIDSLDGGERVLTPLASAQIPEDSCGMVLWTLDGQRPTPIFRFVIDEGAAVSLSNAPVALQRVDYSGAGDFGVFEKQSFRSDAGLIVNIEASFGLDFEGGAYLERGLVKLSDSSGWSLVAPAAGIAGCR